MRLLKRTREESKTINTWWIYGSGQPGQRSLEMVNIRMGEIQEVVDAVLFLTDAMFTTGEILHVDGGAHAGKW